MKQALTILRFLRDSIVRGERTALVTLTDVTGSAARAPGEHMAVAESGRSAGSFSGGCIEAAVIAEALEAISEGDARHVRFGEGSPYIDVRLPCGGGIDLLFTPIPDQGQIDQAIALLERREPVTLSLNLAGAIAAMPSAGSDSATWCETTFFVRHDPVLRLVVMGQGAEPAALLDVAAVYGADLELLSPQHSLVEEASHRGIPVCLLRFIDRPEHMSIDAWTAVVTLFHDHDWETALLGQALSERPFFIGAMGSRRTHIERRKRLLDAGAHPRDIDRIVGPVGLIRATRDPQTLALSIMAQVVEAYEAAIACGRPQRSTVSEPHGSIEQSS